MTKTMDPNDYLTLFETLAVDSKIRFLKEALSSSESLQQQFVNYFAETENQPSEDFLVFNESVKEEAAFYIEELESINLEDFDWEDWEAPHNGYIPEYEAEQMMAETEVEGYFSSIFSNIGHELSSGNLEKSFAKITGLLIACQEANVDDPNENLGDPNHYFFDQFKAMADNLAMIIDKTIVNQHTVSKTVTNVLTCFEKGEANGFKTSVHDKLLLNLVTKQPAVWEGLFPVFKNSVQHKKSFPKTSLFVIRNGSSLDTDWIETAELLCTADPAIALELLDHYANEDFASFYRVAKATFEKFPRELCDFLLLHIDDKRDPFFSKQVLACKVENSREIKDYMRIAQLMGEQEKKDFINSFKNGWDTAFYIQILELEGLLAEILDFAQKWYRNLGELEMILKPVLFKYPEACGKIVSEKISKQLESSMGRDIYSEAADLLRFLAGNPICLPMVKTFTLELLAKYSRRPALKQELKKRDLI